MAKMGVKLLGTRYTSESSHPKVDHFQFHPYAGISKIDGEDDTFRLANIDF